MGCPKSCHGLCWAGEVQHERQLLCIRGEQGLPKNSRGTNHLAAQRYLPSANVACLHDRAAPMLPRSGAAGRGIAIPDSPLHGVLIPVQRSSQSGCCHGSKTMALHTCRSTSCVLALHPGTSCPELEPLTAKLWCGISGFDTIPDLQGCGCIDFKAVCLLESGYCSETALVVMHLSDPCDSSRPALTAACQSARPRLGRQGAS